ncbi:MAG: hypothetical protein FD180_5164 [Planctomycetota bacterium]|nr:MAG: hypothetical protein FD180_5164 [Planctomycetota bacterium]
MIVPMKAAFLIVLALAIPPLLACAGDPVVLEGPAESTKGELDQCATALGRRLAAFGLKGLKVAAVEKDGKRTVEVSSNDEIAPETRTRIEALARHAGQKPVVKFERALTEQDTAQGFAYEKVKDPKTTKAPPGTAWAACVSNDLKDTKTETDRGWVSLLRDSPYVNWTEITVTEKGTSEWSFKFSPASTKVMQFESTGGEPGRRAEFAYVRIAFDWFCTHLEIKVTLSEKRAVLKECTFKLPADLAEYLDPVLRNPMPKPLKRPGSDK